MTNSAAATPGRRNRILDLGSWLLTILTLICAAIWFFPIYWALVTSFRTDDESIKSYSLWPERPTLQSYLYIIQHSKLPIFYLNSTIVSLAVTALSLGMSVCAGYAISQLRFPGRRVLWWTILASFMIPVSALIAQKLPVTAQLLVLLLTLVMKDENFFAAAFLDHLAHHRRAIFLAQDTHRHLARTEAGDPHGAANFGETVIHLAGDLTGRNDDLEKLLEPF